MKTFKTWQMQKLIEGTHVMQHVMGRCVLTYIYMYVDRPRYIYVYIHSLMYIWDVHVQMWNHYWKSTTHLDDTVQLSKLKRVVWVGSNKSVGKNFSFPPYSSNRFPPWDKTAAWISNPYSNKDESSMQMNRSKQTQTLRRFPLFAEKKMCLHCPVHMSLMPCVFRYV